jgi:hypothetical protein
MNSSLTYLFKMGTSLRACKKGIFKNKFLSSPKISFSLDV